MSLKVVPFDRLVWFPISVFNNFVLKHTVFAIFDLKYTVTLKPGLRVTQGHRR